MMIFFKPGKTYDITVKPNSKKNEILISNDKVAVSVTTQPENDKANKAVLKLLKKEFKIKAEIIKGHHSRKKVILIL